MPVLCFNMLTLFDQWPRILLVLYGYNMIESFICVIILTPVYLGTPFTHNCISNSFHALLPLSALIRVLPQESLRRPCCALMQSHFQWGYCTHPMIHRCSLCHPAIHCHLFLFSAHYMMLQGVPCALFELLILPVALKITLHSEFFLFLLSVGGTSCLILRLAVSYYSCECKRCYLLVEFCKELLDGKIYRSV